MALEDRRRRRSPDPLVALHYQLAHTRHEGALDTVVVADEAGVVVAGAGSWAACEELAAYAPLLARESDLGSRAQALRPHVTVQAVTIGSDQLLLCARAAQSTGELGSLRDAALGRAVQGVTRILSVAA